MPDVLIRDLSHETVSALKRRAVRNGRSAAAELRVIVNEAVKVDKQEEWWAEATQLRESLRGRVHGNSADLIREDRDTR